MKCPYCRAEVSPEVKYCAVCGVPVVNVPRKAASTAKEPSGEKTKSRMVAAAVYIVIIVIVLSIPAYITIRTVVNVTTTAADISVVDATIVDDPFHTPKDGRMFVQLTVTLTNNGGSTLSLGPDNFQVNTADSRSYAYAGDYDHTVPNALTAGSTATFSITFEVPTDKDLTKLVYRAMMTSDSVEATIGAVGPLVVRMTVEVNDVTDLGASEGTEKKVVLVDFDMTNGYDEPLNLTLSTFILRTSSGDFEDVSTESMGELAPGASGSFSLEFEIPLLDIPEALIFESGGIELEAAVS
ncbi:MAG: DUF4352 domain-containing protein [Thermoplasmata archaeon]|jgi:hypothetical protein|nr:DUF4352 domain-containing protein [Thermoplasmata archaeon]